jgi:hypothetical protein
MSEQPQLPQVADVMVSTAASLVNLAGIRLTDPEQKDPAQAKEAIDAARALLPLCPEDAIAPIKDALAQVQMLYVKETGGPSQTGSPSRPAEQGASDEAERAKARAKIWTPGSP